MLLDVMKIAMQDELDKIAGELQGFTRIGRKPISVERLLERESEQESPTEVFGLGVSDIQEKISMAFLEQDRPEGVKDVYRALKRDHPDMPAEKKARIAARQGKKGKQHQGPPYKGPLTKENAMSPNAMKGMALLGTGAVGYHLLRKANEDRRMGKMMRLQSGDNSLIY